MKLPVVGRRRARARRAPRRRRARRSARRRASTSSRALVATRAARARRAARHRAPPGRAARRRRRTRSPRSSTTRSRCSTARGSRHASASSRSSSPRTRQPSSSTRVADRLRAAGAGEPEQIPKIVRALGPRALDPPDLVAPPTLDFASTPAEVLRAAIGALDRAAARARPRRAPRRRPRGRAPGPGRDPPAALRPAYVPRGRRSRRGTTPLRDELKWLGGAARARCATPTCCSSGSSDRLARAAADRSSTRASGCSTGLREHREPRPRRAARRRCAPTATLALLDRLVAAARAVPSSGDGDEPRARARRPRAEAVEEAAQRRCDALGDDPPDEELHAVRIRAKRCRYAAEAVAPAVGQGGQALRRRGRRRPGRARRAPGRGGRRAVAPRPTRPTAADASSARSSPASSPRVEDVAADAVARGVARRPGSSAEARRAAQVDVSRTPTVRAAGGIVRRRSPDGERAGAARAPAPLRRLEPAQGQGRPRRARRGDRPARGRGGDRPALRARRTRRARPATATPRAGTRSCATG